MLSALDGPISIFVRHVHVVRRMSLTAGRLLITPLDSLSLSVYEVATGREDVVSLPASVKKPFHAVETLEHKTIIVCYCSIEVKGGLMEVDRRTGSLLRKFDYQEELCMSIHLAVDSVGHVLFADWYGDVKLLNDGLELMGCLFNCEQLYSEPYELSYSLSSNVLLVGLDNGDVRAYNWQ